MKIYVIKTPVFLLFYNKNMITFNCKCSFIYVEVVLGGQLFLDPEAENRVFHFMSLIVTFAERVQTVVYQKNQFDFV